MSEFLQANLKRIQAHSQILKILSGLGPAESRALIEQVSKDLRAEEKAVDVLPSQSPAPVDPGPFVVKRGPGRPRKHPIKTPPNEDEKKASAEAASFSWPNPALPSASPSPPEAASPYAELPAKRNKSSKVPRPMIKDQIADYFQRNPPCTLETLVQNLYGLSDAKAIERVRKALGQMKRDEKAVCSCAGRAGVWSLTPTGNP